MAAQIKYDAFDELRDKITPTLQSTAQHRSPTAVSPIAKLLAAELALAFAAATA